VRKIHSTLPFPLFPLLIMEDVKTPPPPPPAGEVMEPVESVDPKMTVMGGTESQKASDYANCKCNASHLNPSNSNQSPQRAARANKSRCRWIYFVWTWSVSPAVALVQSQLKTARVFGVCSVWCIRPPPPTALAAAVYMQFGRRQPHNLDFSPDFSVKNAEG